MGRLGSLMSARLRADSSANRFDGFILSDDACFQYFFHFENFLSFPFGQTVDRNSGLFGDNVRDIFIFDDDLMLFFIDFPFGADLL